MVANGNYGYEDLYTELPILTCVVVIGVAPIWLWEGDKNRSLSCCASLCSDVKSLVSLFISDC